MYLLHEILADTRTEILRLKAAFKHVSVKDYKCDKNAFKTRLRTVNCEQLQTRFNKTCLKRIGIECIKNCLP